MHPHSYVPRAMARGGVRRRAGAPMVERRRPSLKVRCCTPHRRATTTCSARGRRRAAGAANVMCACTQLARMGAARARERYQGGRADRWRRGWRRGWRRCATAVQRERGKHRVRAQGGMHGSSGWRAVWGGRGGHGAACAGQGAALERATRAPHARGCAGRPCAQSPCGTETASQSWPAHHRDVQGSGV